jgi:hypothetical protein
VTVGIINSRASSSDRRLAIERKEQIEDAFAGGSSTAQQKVISQKSSEGAK